MIPAIALMIAVYGTGRLINDCADRSDTNAATMVMVVVSGLAILALWALAGMVNLSAADVGAPFR